MKQTRRIFVLFIMMLTLSGCTTASVQDTTFMKTNESLNVEGAEELTYKTYDEVNLENALSTQWTTRVISETEIIAQPELEVREYDGRAGIPWMSYISSEGTPTIRKMDYQITEDQNGDLIAKTPILGSVEVIDGQPKIEQYGAPLVAGANFAARTTTYGMDCVGCNIASDGTAGTAYGVRLHPEKGVRQPNGQFLPGVKYNGYYMVAADPSIPFCTVVEVSNHGYSGYGITPSQPFYAIVTDRGGAIRGQKLDLYVGLESNNSMRLNGAIHNPHVKIVSVGGGC